MYLVDFWSVLFICCWLILLSLRLFDDTTSPSIIFSLLIVLVFGLLRSVSLDNCDWSCSCWTRLLPTNGLINPNDLIPFGNVGGLFNRSASWSSVGIWSCSPGLISFDCSSVVINWCVRLLLARLVDGSYICFCWLSSSFIKSVGDCDSSARNVDDGGSWLFDTLSESLGVGDRGRSNGDKARDGRRAIIATSWLSRSVSLPVSSGNFDGLISVRFSSPDVDC